MNSEFHPMRDFDHHGLKTLDSCRSVPISHDALDIHHCPFNAHDNTDVDQERQSGRRFFCGHGDCLKASLLFAGATFSDDDFNQSGTIEIPVIASAHDLRRAFGFRWSSQVNSMVLKELMRHASVAATEKMGSRRIGDPAFFNVSDGTRTQDRRT